MLAWLILKPVVDLDVIHKMLVLQHCRMKVLWGCGSFHQDFKGKPGRTGHVWQAWSPCWQPLIGWDVRL
jgi:hypothetical protein